MAETFRLTPEQVVALRGNIPKINAARDTALRLERIGVPVDEEKERLDLAEKVTRGMLTEFSPTGRPQQ
jgi:hypothetical protein